MVGCGNVKGNKNNNKGWPKRSGHTDRDKGVSQSLLNPKKVESGEIYN